MPRESSQDNERLALITERLKDPATVREAFADAVRMFTEPIYWQIRRMVGDHDDANDLLQNTFLKAWQSVENFRGEARLSTWLHKIAINEALTFLDKQKNRRTQPIDGDCGDAPSPVASIPAPEQLDGDALAAELQKAIATLPEKQRLIFNMKYFDDMKYEDISQILGTSVGALKASYHLATQKIEKYFNNLD